MHRGRKESQSAIYNKQQIVQCSAVQSEYRAYVLRESSAYPERGANPAFLFRNFSYFFPFTGTFLPSFFFFLPSSKLSGLLFCDLLLRSILHLHFVFLLRWRSGEVGNRGEGMHGPMGAWHNSNRGLEKEGGKGKSRRASVLYLFSSIYIFIFFPFLKCKFFTSVWEGVLFFFLFCFSSLIFSPF